jgi:hypothetical protein
MLSFDLSAALQVCCAAQLAEEAVQVAGPLISSDDMRTALLALDVITKALMVVLNQRILRNNK